MLLKTFLIFGVLTLAFGNVIKPKSVKRPTLNGRIVGGELGDIKNAPWQVSLSAFGFHNCGGSIIAPNIVVTAAHCVDSFIATFYTVISGTSNLSVGGTNSNIQQTIVHEGYDGLSNDVALLILSESLVFDEITQAVALTSTEPATDSVVTVTGWGLLNEDDLFTPSELYTVDVNIIDRAECASAYSVFDDATVDESMICAGVTGGGKDACSGDSGGPLVHDKTLVGIVSWGEGCAEPEYPGVYTNVANVRDWIKTNSGV